MGQVVATPAVHRRQTYHRPSWQGGDVVRPLCMSPVVGAPEPVGRPRGWVVSSDAAVVTCASCQRAAMLRGWAA